jgi:ankyrin repeat domain-containing protein 50
VELGKKLLGETAKAVSLLVQCDTYQELFMAQDPALCPPEDTLDRLKTSIVQVYAQSQLLLGFTIQYHQYHQSKVKIIRAPLNIISAPWKLEGLKDFADKLSENKSQLLQVADDCALLNRTNFQKLLKIDKDLGTMNSNLVSALEQLDEDKRVRILKWISPILSHEHHDTIKEVRTAGTCEWLIQNERFREWRDASSSATLWLHSSRKWPGSFPCQTAEIY